MKKIVPVLVLLIVVFSSCSEFNKAQKSNDINHKYEVAKKYYAEEEYFKTSILLESILPYVKGDPIAEDVLFIYAYCQYKLEQYYLSASYFNEYYRTFSRSKRKEEAMFLEAMSLYYSSPRFNLDQTATYRAINKLQSFMNKYPQSEHFSKCNEYLIELREKLEYKAFRKAKLYYDMSYYKSAVISLEEFIKRNSDSKYVEEAAFMRIDAQYNLAQVSVENKKKDRYLSAIRFYEEFIDQFKDSEYQKRAQNIYESSRQKVENINNNEEQ